MGSLLLNKKAASSAIAVLIIFITTIAVTTGIMVAMKDQFDMTTNTILEQQESEQEKLSTIMNIDYVYYNESTNRVIGYLKNNGKTRLDPYKLEYFVDNERIHKNSSNINLVITPDTDINGNEVLDKGELLHITIENQNLDTADIHTFRVIAVSGVHVEEDF